jgi:hypothetical protein
MGVRSMHGMTELTVIFHNFAKAPKKWDLSYNKNHVFKFH